MSATPQAPDGITLLMEDHRLVERLHEQFKATPATDVQRRKELVNQIVRELSMHAIVEEEYLYPATAEAFPGGDELAHHSVDEHQEIKEVLNDVDHTAPDDPALDGKLDDLMADVTHHVQEEEDELFPKLRDALGQERIQQLGEQLARAKKTAPTHPHPKAPNTPPANKIVAPPTAAADRVRDTTRDYPDNDGR